MAIKASYSEIYDLQTKENAISALKFHTPQDGAPARHLGGLIAQFRKYKYLGANIALVPAQTLPLDPLQVSYDAGDQLADPRDILNPILHKHYSGERTLLDLFLDGYFTKKIRGNKGVIDDPSNPESTNYNPGGQSVDETNVNTLENDLNATLFYGNLLMDNSWRAAHVQAGLRIKVRPFVWDVQSTRPLGQTLNKDQHLLTIAKYTETGIPNVEPMIKGPLEGGEMINPIISGGITTNTSAGTGNQIIMDDWQFIGSGTMPLNWLPTNNTIGSGLSHTVSEVTRFRIPKIYMHIMVLPPAFKTSFYYRLVVKHKFLFKDMSSLAAIDSIDVQAAYENRPSAYTPPSAKSRLETIGQSSEHDDGSNSAIEAIGIEMEPMGSVFQYDGDVEDDYMDISKAPDIKTMDEKIKEIIEEGEDKK